MWAVSVGCLALKKLRASSNGNCKAVRWIIVAALLAGTAAVKNKALLRFFENQTISVTVGNIERMN